MSVHPSAPLTNYKIVSDIRVEIAHLLDIDAASGYWPNTGNPTWKTFTCA